MRAVLVNHCHPEMDHVCALRVATFARFLADKGHRVVVLSGPLNGQSSDLSIGEHQKNLTGHDWSKPYILPCKPLPAPLLERLHRGRLPGGLRQAVVAAAYLFGGGVFNNWTRGAAAASDLLAKEFAPDVVWATFGNTDSWNIARNLADLAGCPWVADMKDNWDHYIPAPFRSLLAGRYRSAARFTALSQGHADLVARRFGVPARVIYSGFGEPSDLEPDALRLVISGSIYDGKDLGIMVRGVEAWLDQASPDSPVEVCYFGNDHRLAKTVLTPLGRRCHVVVRPFIEPVELAPLLAKATAILFPRHSPMLYHHKFGDYMASARPVICLPGESAECRGIAEQIGAPLFSCETAEQVTEALRAVAAGDFPALDKNRLAAYSWQQQARRLEDVFSEVISR